MHVDPSPKSQMKSARLCRELSNVTIFLSFIIFNAVFYRNPFSSRTVKSRLKRQLPILVVVSCQSYSMYTLPKEKSTFSICSVKFNSVYIFDQVYIRSQSTKYCQLQQDPVIVFQSVFYSTGSFIFTLQGKVSWC